MTIVRRFPVGAELQASGGTHFRVWAPSRKSVEVAVADRHCPLQKDSDGYFSGYVERAKAGTEYKFRLDRADSYPDPASRYQPEGPHGPSEIVDPHLYLWSDESWQGLPLQGQVFYEMHIGTFTREGSWRAATGQLRELASLGVTVIEVMPAADFTGSFGWGYDGVNLYAPSHLYGRPDDMRAFVDRAHALGLGVILDVVYNHFGSDGNYIGQYSRSYFSGRYKTDWGEAISFDEPDSGPVREYFKANAAYWIDEFHLDGLRLDATQNVYDRWSPHILAEITDQVRVAAKGRRTIVIAENETQLVKLVRPRIAGGFGMDGLWNDDFHHSALVALTGHNDAYYSDYKGTPQEFISAMKYGYLYQGQWYKWQKQCRGTSSRGVLPAAFITFIENHDQIANSATGQRVHQLTSPDCSGR
ncbi:MAG: alpha-amylase family glycosyl hydrolase [Bryobacteraceae bacterium]